MRPVVIDTETTGLGQARGREDAIVEVAIAYRNARGTIETWRRTCNPGDRFFADGRADEALRISGIDRAAIQASPGAAEVAAELRDMLKNIDVGGSAQLHAYNMAFDRQFLVAEPWHIAGGWGDCIMLRAHQALDPAGRWPKLVDACSLLNIPYPGPAHRAEFDAHAGLAVWEELTNRRILQPTRAATRRPPRLL